jgi:hypothetical protein
MSEERIVYLPVEVTEYADLYDKGWYFKGRLKIWDTDNVYSIRWDNVQPTAMTMIEEVESTVEGRHQMRMARAEQQRARDNEVRLAVLRDVESNLKMDSACAFADGDTSGAASYAWGKSLETVRKEIRRYESNER